MSETTPSVSPESHTHRIPIFQMNASLLGLSDSSIDNTSKDQEITKNECPHVLIADDDPFQQFFYSQFFEKLIGLDNPTISKSDFQFKMFASGEDLLEKYQKLNFTEGNCPLLIITDYDMGENKLNGVETALLLRRQGYEGAIIIRTSEKRQDLEKTHSDLESLLSTKKINCLLDKNYNTKTKEVIKSFLTLEGL